MRELASLFPAWARGATLTAAAASLLVFAISSFGAGAVNPRSAITPEQIGTLVNAAIAKERAQMQNEHRAQMSAFKDQLMAEHQRQLQTLSTAHQARLDALQASLKAEIKRSNRQNSSIRSFFAVDDYQDPWADVK